MLRRVNFWKEENDAPLLRNNRSFLPCTSIVDRIKDEDEADLNVDFDHERIIRHDAERTFLGEAQRITLMNVLSSLSREFNSYHQAMSYVAAFLLLTHSPLKVIEIMRQLHRTVLIGYWTEEPVAFATDAYVFDYLLADFEPEIQKHLSKNYILPETYVQKWFTTLCVGVLPFKALFLFFDTFLDQSQSSNIFLFQFALSFMKHIRDELLQAKNAAAIYQYLRLDTSSVAQIDKKIDDLTISIIEGAKEFDLTGYDFDKLRKKAYDEKLHVRLEAAKRVHQENKIHNESLISTSSSSSSSDDDDDDDEAKMKTLVSDMEQLHIK